MPKEKAIKKKTLTHLTNKNVNYLSRNAIKKIKEHRGKLVIQMIVKTTAQYSSNINTLRINKKKMNVHIFQKGTSHSERKKYEE